jgi:hypothetical protein
VRLPDRSLNPSLTSSEREVILIETVQCSGGDRFSLTFESADPRWRQGVWLAVDGTLAIGDHESSLCVLWHDTAPHQVRVEVRSTQDGLLRLYNVWDSGRGYRPWESQSHTSGMISEVVPGGSRYHCSDINPHPTYDALVFTLTRD